MTQQQSQAVQQDQPATPSASQEMTDQQLDAVAGGMIIYGNQLAPPVVNLQQAVGFLHEV